MTDNVEKPTLTPEQQESILNGGKSSQDATKPDVKKIEDEGDQGAPAPKPEDKPKPEEKKPEEKPSDKNEDGSWKDEYVKIENPHAAAAINLLKKANVSPVEANDIFKEALDSNDLSKVDWARLEKRLGADEAALVKAGVTQYYNEEYKKVSDTVKLGYEMFGGEENWNKVRAHFQAEEKKDPALKAKLNSIRKSLDLGDWAAETALKELKSMYENSPNTKGLQNAPTVRGGALPVSDTKDLSAADFKTQYPAALAAGNRALVNELRERRANTLQRELGK